MSLMKAGDEQVRLPIDLKQRTRVSVVNLRETGRWAHISAYEPGPRQSHARPRRVSGLVKL
jgi:hypothetical protein